jgi:hypothetical protein
MQMGEVLFQPFAANHNVIDHGNKTCFGKGACEKALVTDVQMDLSGLLVGGLTARMNAP